MDRIPADDIALGKGSETDTTCILRNLLYFRSPWDVVISDTQAYFILRDSVAGQGDLHGSGRIIDLLEMVFKTSRFKFLLDSEAVLILAYGRDRNAFKAEIADMIGKIRRRTTKFLPIRETVEKDFSQTYDIIFHIEYYLLIFMVKMER